MSDWEMSSRVRAAADRANSATRLCWSHCLPYLLSADVVGAATEELGVVRVVPFPGQQDEGNLSADLGVSLGNEMVRPAADEQTLRVGGADRQHQIAQDCRLGRGQLVLDRGLIDGPHRR